MGEDAEHIIMDSDRAVWQEDHKGLWECVTNAKLASKLTFTQLINMYGPLKIFRAIS